MENKRRKQTPADFWLLAAALVFPVIIVSAQLSLGDKLPLQALVVMIGAYIMGLAWTGMAMVLRAQEARTRSSRADLSKQELAALIGKLPELEPVYTVAAPYLPRMIKVVGTVGVCPWGLKIGDSLKIDGGGQLSAPLCRAAVGAIETSEVLEHVLVHVSPRQVAEREVSCVCPLAGRQLTFAVGPPREVYVN